MLKLLDKFFRSKRQKDVDDLRPVVTEINEYVEEYASLSDEELRAKTDEFRSRINAVIAEDEQLLAETRESLKTDLNPDERLNAYEEIARLEKAIYRNTQDMLNEILPEAFAVVKETCRRHVGKEWEAGGSLIRWEMVHYDVQLIGGMVLHQGKIAEMATGEGKTLVATLPTYLNALAGRGLHIITVNDYLARRDAEWMGPIYQFLGLTVGCIQANQQPAIRRKQYETDITFGTNNEFGFDYLRDNMVGRPDDMVQRGHNFAIIDEVDSILIDEARTPLIISGPVESSSDQSFMLLKPRIDRIVNLQNRECAGLVAEAERILAENPDAKSEQRAQAGVNILRAHRGSPKNKRLMKMLQEPSVKRLLEETELEYLRDKGARMQEIDKELYYAIDEKNHSIDMSDKGRHAIASSGEDPDMFLLPDLSTDLSMIAGSDLPAAEKQHKTDEVMRVYAERSDRIHTITQLLRAYALYEKDDEYVIDEGKIKIVDEFTGRILEGRRYSDGLHQAIEAKEGVRVEEDTQTFATVTIQNYFRLYKKLAGMTGTAETEEGEFNEIYKLDVVVIPTNRDVVRNDMNDLIYRTKREKYNAVVKTIDDMRAVGRPVLVGTTSVEVSETLSRMLQRAKIPHSVLNAKQHAREAEIVTTAGQKGAVTIATNMAGRGTDIKLGPGVKEIGGLHILGTERHESRRIDRQLRGRAGRQGDPGSSQFFISLEDDLLRLFGGERITRWMEKLGAADEVLEHPMLNKAVERSQKKVEENNFSIRKRLLEFDNVMNQQREVIYDRRKHALGDERMKAEVMTYFEEYASSLIAAYCPENMEALRNELRTRFLIDVEIDTEKARNIGEDAVRNAIIDAADDFYTRKEQDFGVEFMGNLERYAILTVIDEHWRDHMREMDELKEGIYLRAYGQKDPLIEYKREAFTLFQSMITEINTKVASMVFRYFPDVEAANRAAEMRKRQEERAAAARRGSSASRQLQFTHSSVSGMASGGGEDGAPITGGEPVADTVPKTVVRTEKKVGRNDPCWCGSGKKFKHCHGKE